MGPPRGCHIFLKCCGLVYFSVTGIEIINCSSLSDSMSHLPFLGSTHPLEPTTNLLNPTHPVSNPPGVRGCQAKSPSFPEPPVRPWRDRPQSSIYDPFAGMKTPGQRQLITLQEQVKLGIVNVDEAVLHFKEWQLNQKKRSESFRFQQVTDSGWNLSPVCFSARQ